MKLKKLKLDTVIEVIWRDSNTPGDNWIVEEELVAQHEKDLLIKSLGYVFRINRQCLTLYGGTFITEAWRKRYERVVSIPIGCIISVKEMK